MKIAIIGTGYIGLVTGTCLAKKGHDVICVDKDAGKISQLQRGIIPIFEPGLAGMLAEVIGNGRLLFSTDTAESTRKSEAIFIGVGTPTAADGYSPDLSFVFSAAQEIAAGLDEFKVVILKSTVPVGTVRKVAEAIRMARPDCDFEMASNPEFLREGAAIHDFMNPDRIVIGTDSMRARAVLEAIYAPFSDQQHAIVHTGFESSELIKLASNGFLATKIAFINEIAELCEKAGGNVEEVAKGMGLDDRIGPRFLAAGPGFGGSCFPKDLRALSAMGHRYGANLAISEATIASNEHAKLRMVDKILAVAGGSLSGLTLAIFGVTFKSDTDDIRDAPSLTILPKLVEKGARLNIVDPQGARHGAAQLPPAQWFDDPYEAASGANMIVVLTEWGLFKTLNLTRLVSSMATPHLADLRNIYPEDHCRAAGFTRQCRLGSPGQDQAPAAARHAAPVKAAAANP